MITLGDVDRLIRLDIGLTWSLSWLFYDFNGELFFLRRGSISSAINEISIERRGLTVIYWGLLWNLVEREGLKINPF
jgi:hypothetical protein